MRVFDYLDSLGLCVRFVDSGSDYKSWPLTEPCLAAIGIKHLRCAAPVPNGQGIDRMKLAMAAGYKFTFTVRNVGSNTFQTELPEIATLEGLYPGHVVAIEGLNEVDRQSQTFTWNGAAAGAASYAKYQDDLYAAIKAHPSLGHLPVLSYTDSAIRNSTCDILNTHNYPRNGALLGPLVHTSVDIAAGYGKPIALTETGFHTFPTGPFPGTDEATQTKLILNAMVASPQGGQARVFLFQLLDAYADGGTMETHFGLFDHAYAAKPAAGALGNLVRYIQDNGASPAAHSYRGIEPAIATTGVKSLVLATSDKTSYLIIWREVPVWNSSTKTAIANTSISVQIDLGQKYISFAELYDPLSNTLTALPTTRLQAIDLNDTPLILKIGDPMPSADYSALDARIAVVEAASGGGSYTWTNSEAAAYLTARGDTLNNTEKGYLDALYTSLKSAGWGVRWSFKWLLLAGKNEAAFLTNAGSVTGPATRSGSGTYTADRGFAGDGTSGYIDLGAAPQTFFTDGKAGVIGGYTNVAGASTNGWLFGQATSSYRHSLLASTTLASNTYRSGVSASSALASGTYARKGQRAARREDASNMSYWYNGAVAKQEATAWFGTNAANLLFLKGNTTFSDDRLAAAYVTDVSLSDTDMGNMQAAIHTYLTAIGANY